MNINNKLFVRLDVINMKATNYRYITGTQSKNIPTTSSLYIYIFNPCYSKNIKAKYKLVKMGNNDKE